MGSGRFIVVNSARKLAQLGIISNHRACPVARRFEDRGKADWPRSGSSVSRSAPFDARLRGLPGSEFSRPGQKDLDRFCEGPVAAALDAFQIARRWRQRPSCVDFSSDAAPNVDWLSFVRPKAFSSVKNDDVTKGNDEITGCRFEDVG
jgi:hypothetical protein